MAAFMEPKMYFSNCSTYYKSFLFLPGYVSDGNFVCQVIILRKLRKRNGKRYNTDINGSALNLNARFL